jgi:hypothetical protein
LSLLTTWSFTVFFLARASGRAPHSWQDKPARRTETGLDTASTSQTPVDTKTFRRTALEQNPFSWLALRGPRKLQHAWGFILAIISIWIFGFLRASSVMWDYELIFPTILFVHGFLKIWDLGYFGNLHAFGGRPPQWRYGASPVHADG